jgi:uncharacterized protein (TIGR02118 family)
MQFNFVAFNFQSADLAAEERNYLGHHVELAKRMPGLRLYYTGRLVKTGGREPERVRAAVLGYDDAAAAAAAARSEVIAALVADTQAHLKDLESKSMAGEAIVPFDARKPGQPCFIMAAEFDLATAAGGLAAAEEHYLKVHVGIARRLPGLRNYMIGKLEPGGADRQRMAVLVFDSHDALRAAYASAAGQELRADEQATIRNARVWRLDARVEI